MKFPILGKLKHLVREGREVLRRSISRSVGAGPLSLPGQFQTYNYTLPDRYPWLFQFADAGARFHNLGAPVEDIGQSLEKLEFLFRTEHRVKVVVWLTPLSKARSVVLDDPDVSRYISELHQIAGLSVVEADNDSPLLADFHQWHDCNHFHRPVFDQLVAPGVAKLLRE